MAAGKPIFRPIIPLLLSLTAGIVAADNLPGYAPAAVGAMLAACVGLMVHLLKRHPSLLLSLALFFAGGYLSLHPWVSPRFTDDHVTRLVGDRMYKIRGRIDEVPLKRPTTTRLVLRMISVTQDGGPRPVRGRIRVTVSGDAAALRKGDEILFYSRIRPFRNFNNPGGFDYRRYMAFKKVWGRAYAPAHRISVVNRSRPMGDSILARHRTRMSHLIDRAIADTDSSAAEVRAVLKALLIGDKTHISRSLRQAFNRSGVGHLLAISGLHVGIVAFSAFLGFRWVLSYCRPLLWKGWPKKAAAVLSFPPVVAYGLLAGMSPSTQRAVIMVGVFTTGYLLDRDQDLFNTIAVAAMIILVLHPPALFAISFQLSFTAVLAIVYGLTCVRTASPQDGPRIHRWLAKLATTAMVTCWAALGTAPLTMHYFNQISLIGVLVNLLVVPIVGFAAVPAGLLSVCIHPVNTVTAFWCMKLSGWVLGHGLHLIRCFAELPFAAVKTVTPNLFELCLVYCMLWGALGWVAAKSDAEKKDTAGGPPKSGRLPAAAAIAAAIVFSVNLFIWFYTVRWHDDLRLTVIDVGQGSSTLLELPGGHNLLVDGGGFSDNAIFDTGEMIVAPLLWRKKIRTIDTIVLSHANSDHLNGLIYIAEHFHVKQTISNHEPSSTASYGRFLSVLEKKGIRHPAFETLDRIFFINGVRLEILHPQGNLQGKRRRGGQSELNNHSIVLKVGFGKHDFLFCGDLMAEGEKELVNLHGANLKSDVLLVPHHGSATSSTPVFLSHVDPETAVISAGWNNRFRFPTGEVLKRYRDRSCTVYRTDVHGAVHIRSDGERLEVVTFGEDSQRETF